MCISDSLPKTIWRYLSLEVCTLRGASASAQVLYFLLLCPFTCFYAVFDLNVLGSNRSCRFCCYWLMSLYVCVSLSPFFNGHLFRNIFLICPIIASFKQICIHTVSFFRNHSGLTMSLLISHHH